MSAVVRRPCGIKEMSGFVYVLSNPCMPGMVKIGWTERHPVDRARELQTTGVPCAFDLVFAIWTSRPTSIESEVHDRLCDFRVASNREFFQIDHWSAAKAIIETLSTLSQRVEFELRPSAECIPEDVLTAGEVRILSVPHLRGVRNGG